MPAPRRPSTGVGVLATVALALAALTGCTADGFSPDPAPTAATLSLHPHGHPGSWMDPAYARGVDGAYVTMNQVCAVTAALSIEVERDSRGDARIVARDLAGIRDVPVWHIDHASCSPGALLPGDPAADEAPARGDTLVVRAAGDDPDDAWTWRVVDATTGAPGPALPVPNTAGRVRPLTWLDGVLVLQMDSLRLVAARILPDVDWREPSAAGTIAEQVWMTPLPDRAEVTVLDDRMAGVINPIGDSVSVIDLRDGSTRMRTSVPRSDWITWASDGYVQKVQETDPEYAFFDLDGKEVDRTQGISQYRFVPGPEDGVTFPIADHRAAGRVVGVDAEGRPALLQDDRQRDHTRTQRVQKLPDSIIMLQGVSRDGSRLLFESEEGGVTLIDETGAQAASWPLPVDGIGVQSGRIVLTSDSATWVLRPARTD